MGRAASRAAAWLLLALVCAARAAAGSHAQPTLEGIPINSSTRSLLVGLATGRSLAEAASQPELGIANSDAYPGIVATATLTSCGGKYRLALTLPAADAGLYRARVKARGVAVAPPADTTASVSSSAGEGCGPGRTGRGEGTPAGALPAPPPALPALPCLSQASHRAPYASLPCPAAAPSAAPVVVGKPGAAAAPQRACLLGSLPSAPRPPHAGAPS